MFPGPPIAWLVGAGVVCVGLFFGAVTIRHNAEVAGARNEGVAIGTGKSSTAALEAVAKTAEAERAAEAETPLPADRAAIIALCKRSASCRERHTLK